jgi:hypothetical protein
MLAMQNVETFNAMGVQKIITQCPHCFNVIKNEYPQIGGNYEVMHHSQLLDELVRDGRLSLAGASLDERVTYHDSCYLGRHNDVTRTPGTSSALRQGSDRCRRNAGVRRAAWMEESTGKKVHTNAARRPSREQPGSRSPARSAT